MRNLVLLSGGIDSAVCLSQTLEKGVGEVVAITFCYGSLNEEEEKKSAAAIADFYGVRQMRVPVPNLSVDSTGYVPARNTILVSLAASFAETQGFDSLYISTNADDSLRFPDCRPEYLEAMGKVLALGLTRKLALVAPFLYWSKKQVVREGVRLEVPFSLTHSCYFGSPPCKQCSACLLREEAFDAEGVQDSAEADISNNGGV